MPHVLYCRALSGGESYLAFYDYIKNKVRFYVYGGDLVSAFAGFLRIVTSYHEYSPAIIERVLDKARAALQGDADNPLAKQVKINERADAYVVFSVNLGNEDPETKRHIFALLRETLIPWLKRDVPATNADQAPQAAGSV